MHGCFVEDQFFIAGVGCLLLYDYDTVQICNMNRMFFRPQQIGMAKTEAAAASLMEINPDVKIETFNMNITTVEGFRKFRTSLTCTDTGESRVKLLLSCVDNYEARVHINRICLDLQQVWMESGVSENAVSGKVFMKCSCYLDVLTCADGMKCSLPTFSDSSRSYPDDTSRANRMF